MDYSTHKFLIVICYARSMGVQFLDPRNLFIIQILTK